MIASDDVLDGKLIYLPPEAGDVNQPRFEPNDDWLRQAPADHQKSAMWRWLATHYEDPHTATPHDQQGNFNFLDGGPFLADELLTERFQGVVDDDVIHDFIRKVQAEVGNEWALKRLDRFGG